MFLRAARCEKHCHHRHTLTPDKVYGSVQRVPFQRRLFAPRRAQNLLAGCIFDGLACQKCFCVTLDKSNRTEDEQVYEIGGITYAKNDKRNGR